MTNISNTSTAPFGFGGEAFLTTPLPDYPAERQRLSILLVAALIAWIVVVPYVLGAILIQRAKRKATTSNEKVTDKTNQTQDTPAVVVDDTTSFLFTIISICSGIMCIVSVCWIIWQSSVNSFTSRAVFEAPLLTPDECQTILDYANEAARQNVIKAAASSANNNTTAAADAAALLKEPAGWQKSRHTIYQTTDLNLVTDPFSGEAREYISQKLNARLAPLLQRIFGVTPRAIRANDMFVVRYDSEERPFLEKHTDDADISFNILLSDDFEGGGTRFWNRLQQQPFALVQPQKGQVISHSALIHHEGMPVTKGVRHILVGFLAVDHVDPFTAQPTGLSWFNSWLSLPFLHVKFKDGWMATKTRRSRPLRNLSSSTSWTDNKFVQSLFSDLVNYIQYCGDVWAPHVHYNLVAPNNATHYLKSMDASFETQEHPPMSQWFRGQQIIRNINGVLLEEWDTRKQDQDRFQDL